MNLNVTIEKFARPSQKSHRVFRREITAQLLKIVSSFLPEYLSRCFDDTRTASDILNEISRSINDNFKSLWIFTDEKSVAVGFAFAEVMYSEVGGKVANIHHLFISGKSRKLIHEFDFKVGEWGKSLGATEVGCYTRRNAKAFLRRVKNGWEFDCYVLKRKI